MSDTADTAPIIDFASERRERLHQVHEAKLNEVRSRFEKAFPVPAAGKPSAKARKRKKPRK
ncbi:MAG: hypothetical protein CVV07_07105 [Gammaproteobacteria bacterium HGW-Gammaproteobacteria-11]|nr:MAG: hypothetical protein CVV07_07105 [Gammaproteobacteria bacterium HGW-Gammaproteobacteria-11]